MAEERGIDQCGDDWFGDTTINRGGAEKTEQEGDERMAIVAATMEEESEDIEVGVRIERTSPPPFGAGNK